MESISLTHGLRRTIPTNQSWPSTGASNNPWSRCPRGAFTARTYGGFTTLELINIFLTCPDLAMCFIRRATRTFRKPGTFSSKPLKIAAFNFTLWKPSQIGWRAQSFSFMCSLEQSATRASRKLTAPCLRSFDRAKHHPARLDRELSLSASRTLWDRLSS